MAKAVFKGDFREWDRFISSIRGKMDSRKILRGIVMPIALRDIVDHFAKEQDPDGKSWRPRLASTNKRYQAIKSGTFRASNKILQLTGDLRKSLLPSNVGTQDLGTEQLMLFSPMIYSRAHDLGSSKQNLPRREFMGMSEDSQTRAVEGIAKFVMEGA